jgi:hypothetical protein
VEFVANLVLNDGFADVDQSALVNAVKNNIPSGATVVVTVEYKTSTTYEFDAVITKPNATKGIARTCGVSEDQVSVTIDGSRRLLVEAASPRRLATTAVGAVITSSSPDAADKVHTAAGNASGLASEMSQVTGETIAEPTYTPLEAAVAITTKVTATAASSSVEDLKAVANSASLTDSLAASANATVSIANVTVTTFAPTAAPTAAPTNQPTAVGDTTQPTAQPTAAPTSAPTAAAGSNSTTSAASKTTAQPTQEQESFATMGRLSSTVLGGIVVKLLIVVTPF